jgi:hypothetical protein
VNKKLAKKNDIKIGKTTMTKKEAIVKIKAWDFLDNDEKEILETLIPELKESEDEKIRKELIEHIKANKDADYVLFKKFSSDDVIAWLEKQGKSKWTDEDEENFRDIIGAIHRVAYQPTEDEEARIEYIKSLKQRIKQ